MTDRESLLASMKVVPSKTVEDYRREELLRRFEISQIPKAYFDVSYDEIPDDAPYLKGMNVWKDKAVKALESSNNIPGIYFYGPVGSGKSSIAAIFGKWLLQNRVHVKWVKFRNLYESMLSDEGFRPDSVESKWQVYQTCKVLIIDDIFQYYDTKWGSNNLTALEDLLDTRAENNLTNIITSNLKLEDAEKISSMIRVVGLIRMDCYTLKIDWLDYREALGEEYMGEL